MSEAYYLARFLLKCISFVPNTFDLTPDCGSSAMKGMIKIMKYLVFLSPVMEIGTLFVVFSSRLSLSIIDWFVTKNGQAIHASITYVSKPGCTCNVCESKIIKLQKCVMTARQGTQDGCECEDLRAEVPKLEVVSSRVVYKCALCMCLCIRRQVSIEPNHLRYSCWHIESLILSTLPHTLFRVPRAKNADLVVSE